MSCPKCVPPCGLIPHVLAALPMVHISKRVFTFSLHAEYIKRESIVIAWVEKNILVFWWMFMFWWTQNKQKKFRPSVCLPVCLPVCRSVCTWTFAVDTKELADPNKIWWVWLLCMKCRSDIEIQSKIMILILILNRILILTKTLWNDTKFGRYL